MLRSVLAVVAGYLVTVVVVVLYFAIAVAILGLEPNKTPPTNVMVISIFVSFVAAIIGGLTAAGLAKSEPFQHAFFLLVVGLAMGLVSMALSDGREPFWYQLAIQVVMVVGILIGGQWITIKREKGSRRR